MNKWKRKLDTHTHIHIHTHTHTHTHRLANGAVELAAQNVEVVCGRRAVGDLPVAALQLWCARKGSGCDEWGEEERDR